MHGARSQFTGAAVLAHARAFADYAAQFAVRIHAPAIAAGAGYHAHAPAARSAGHQPNDCIVHNFHRHCQARSGQRAHMVCMLRRPVITADAHAGRFNCRGCDA